MTIRLVLEPNMHALGSKWVSIVIEVFIIIEVGLCSSSGLSSGLAPTILIAVSMNLMIENLLNLSGKWRMLLIMV